ncbi:MAG TPA: error-prone DNA polymerase, partial [Solirubrobacteraceae bacterium]|nr:error-prone DNA polymerase [Solirubrobacteraceae bacterium]
VMEVAEAFAGFSPGEADGLRRAMSRKRSHEEMQRHREAFLAGARAHAGAEDGTAERVWGMVEGFAGFGFPKAHGAAFGLLAYQSTWLRVHYGPEFLCSLLNEQPMGFYAPDSLVHEAQRRGIPVLGLDVNASQVLCTVERMSPGDAPSAAGTGAAGTAGTGAAGAVGTNAVGAAGQALGVRLGLGYIKEVQTREVHALVAERERGGRYESLADLAARAGAGPATLSQLAWSGACDELAGDVQSGMVTGAGTGAGASEDGRRRLALWQLGLAGHARMSPAGEAAQTQLALGLELPEAPLLRPLGRWERLIADYSTSGVTAADHAMAILRERLSLPMLATSAQLARLPSGGAVTVAGLVIARQRPGTAKGTMFLLFEDEHGAINLIVPRHVYERYRHLARAEPLLIARGRLERSEGVVNVLVSELLALEQHLDPVPGGEREQGSVHRLAAGERGAADGRGARERTAAEAEAERAAAEVGSSMRAVAPPMQSFGRGRRR